MIEPWQAAATGTRIALPHEAIDHVEGQPVTLDNNYALCLRQTLWRKGDQKQNDAADLRQTTRQFWIFGNRAVTQHRLVIASSAYGFVAKNDYRFARYRRVEVGDHQVSSSLVESFVLRKL